MGRSRSRERNETKKYRSRSEESAERSREREKRRRRQQREFMQKYGGGNKGGGRGGGGGGKGGGGDGERKSEGIFWDGFQWIPVGDKGNKGNDAATRKLRRLYLGNLPIQQGLTEKHFMEEMIRSMRSEGIVDPKKTELEISKECNLWFSRDNNYGFMECATVEDAEKILVKLNGMMVMGQPVEIKRPNEGGKGGKDGGKGKYDGGKGKYDGGKGKGYDGGKGGYGYDGGKGKGGGPSVVCNSRCLEISMALVYDPAKTDPELFEETLEDMTEGCGQHGKINNGKIVRPDHQGQIQGGHVPPTVKVGNVYLEFVSVADAAAAMGKMQNRKYDGRLLQFQAFPEDKFYSIIMNLS